MLMKYLLQLQFFLLVDSQTIAKLGTELMDYDPEQVVITTDSTNIFQTFNTVNPNELKISTGRITTQNTISTETTTPLPSLDKLVYLLLNLPVQNNQWYGTCLLNSDSETNDEFCQNLQKMLDSSYQTLLSTNIQAKIYTANRLSSNSNYINYFDFVEIKYFVLGENSAGNEKELTGGTAAILLENNLEILEENMNNYFPSSPASTMQNSIELAPVSYLVHYNFDSFSVLTAVKNQNRREQPLFDRRSKKYDNRRNLSNNDRQTYDINEFQTSMNLNFEPVLRV